ncbi:glycosyltransferase family 2 protein [Tamlana fucoidanivorans]|uniref:Glycosyltransferase family 2 protein n=1 Tax=Allotamlana fucoidanivorans TaxID=2583814 RepID=A0A5C4SLV4_9FLAO|nr:glycosyltransferase family 2 protein [Tamlana fucoidanivorans]TNJ44672.1 glycosyltransferase family 2 protein [Tamlana fucoidanivorans]
MKIRKQDFNQSNISITANLNLFVHLFQTKLKRFKKENLWGILVLSATFLLIIDAVYLGVILRKDIAIYNAQRLSTTFGVALMIFSIALLLFKGSFFIYTLFRYFKYKPITSVSDTELPSCTVIVPAYNEGKQVYDTLMSLAQSEYPEEKFELLSIDDGSQDDTWPWMIEAKKVLGDRLKIHQQPENKGKRHALYYGFNNGTGDVFVTVDSDSIVNPDTLRNLIGPLVTDETCGAVAGNIRVLNKDKGLLPKMLDVSFVLSFEFVRSAESTLKSVLCTPGALAAYRRAAVFNCLQEWMNQTFMGNPSDIGEDRALTNMILKQGYHVLFQRNAYAYTNVPEKYRGLYKMFIRWGRSNVRENIEMSKYVFKNFRKGSKLGTRLLFLSQSVEIIMTYPFLILMILFIFTHPILFLSSTFLSILVVSTFPVLFYAKRYDIKASFWAYTYSILYTFGLFWITPYAIATASKSGWLTRELPKSNTV